MDVSSDPPIPIFCLREVGGARLLAAMSRRGSNSAPQPPASAATSGARQPRFLEELSSLLRPEPRPQRAERRPPIPPAGQLARTRPARASVGRGACPAGRERQTSGTISSSDLPDPRDYLNSAELLLDDSTRGRSGEKAGSLVRGRQEGKVSSGDQKERERCFTLSFARSAVVTSYEKTLWVS